MGFEVLYMYFERDDDGNYNRDEVKEMKKKVGEPFEEISLEKLASVIMTQLARRDVWIHDVKIFELAKKEISFKETKGGIVIKHKKFSLDAGANIICQDIQETKPVVTTLPVPMHPQQIPTNINIAGPARRPIKFIVLDSDPQTVMNIKKSGLAFTPNKRYPVFSETPHPKEFGIHVYATIDDNKREVTVRDSYFVNADQILSRNFNTSIDQDNAPKLDYGGYADKDMPDIRGR